MTKAPPSILLPSTAALSKLKSALLTLKNSGDDGFEGLVAALLGAVTHMNFRLAVSGSQDGQDGRAEGMDGAISFEAKLYTSKLTKSVVNNKATEILASGSPPDLWVLGATVGASTQIVTTLRAAFAKGETSLLLLDWPINVSLPPLALLCAMAPETCTDFVVRNSRTGVDLTELVTGLEALATLSGFGCRA